MRFFFTLISTVLCSVALAAGQASSVEEIFARAPHQDADTVRGSFVQYKHLAELERPLVSRGEFTAARGRGIIWRITAPIESTLVITDEYLIESVNGRETMRVSADERPGLKWVGSILMAVFRSNTEKLEQFFTVHAETLDDNRWTLELVPRLDAVAKYLKTIRVTGADEIEEIRIEEQGGDSSVIEIQSLAGSRQGLTAQEQQLLQ